MYKCVVGVWLQWYYKIYAALNLELSIYKGIIRPDFIFVTGTIYVRSTFACALIHGFTPTRPQLL